MITPEEQEFDRLHDKRMWPAIEAGSASVAREVFSSMGAPSQFQLRQYLQDILWLDSHEEMARHSRSENTLSKSIMAKDEIAYEQGLVDIVRQIAQHIRMVPEGNMAEFAPAGKSFSSAYRPYRLPAALAIVQETLIQESSWKPNIRRIFEGISLDSEEERESMIGYRADKADHINTLGAAVTRWLATEAPPSLMMRMSAPDQQYWRGEGWRTDATEMPWQTPTQQMQQFNMLKAIVSFIPRTEDSDLAASRDGLRARELGNGLLGHIASRSKNEPQNT